MKSYAELLRHPKWQRKALEIKERDNFTCMDCGARADAGARLEVHHCAYVHGRKPWEYENGLLLTLCHTPCHPRRQEREIALRLALAQELAKWPIERLERGMWHILEMITKEAA